MLSSRGMSRRLGRVHRLVVLLILGWTALDLGFPVLCAVDREQSGSAYCAADIIGAPSASSSQTPQSPGRIDDCFCCSHVVTVAAVASAQTMTSTVRQQNIDVQTAPTFRAFPIYHPPQLSL